MVKVTRLQLCTWAVLSCCFVTPGCYDAAQRPLSRGVPLDPDASGAVDSEELGITGHWYAYGDRYDAPATCTFIGKHKEEECALISVPPVSDRDEACGDAANCAHRREFRRKPGGMCTSGVVEKVVDCGPGGSCTPDISPGLDFDNMWGAGIGVDFQLSAHGDRDPWDAEQAGIIGVSFELRVLGDAATTDLPASQVRVAFPIQFAAGPLLPKGKQAVLRGGEIIGVDAQDRRLPDGSTSEEYPGGSPFWRAKASQGKWDSLVAFGYNRVMFSEVFVPPTVDLHYVFDVRQLLGVQFQAVPDPAAAREIPFNFCIDDLVLLRE